MEEYVGKTVYRYNIKNGKFYIHEGVVTKRGRFKEVYFKDENYRARCPGRNQFGMVLTSKTTVWLLERNDELAKRIFIEYEEQKLNELQEQLNKKLELIKTLKMGS